MENTLSFSLLGSPDLEANPAFNVLVVYEDFETGKHAKRTFDYLVEHLGDECRFTNQMWKFDVLAVPKLREMAARDAAVADIIIVSAHGAHPLPPEVKAWIELWLEARSSAIALVALFDVDQNPDNPVRAFLATAAKRAKMEFFSQPGPWPGGERTKLPDVRGLNERTISVLAGAVQERENHTAHRSSNE